MRFGLEKRLVKVEGTDRQIDRGTCELLLKVITQESRERLILQQGSSGPGKKAAAMQSTVGDAK